MTDMHEKVERALEAVQVHVGGHEIYVARDAALTPEEIAAFAQAAINALWPMAMDEAAKVADESADWHSKNDDGLSGLDKMAEGAREVADLIRERKAPL